LCSELSAQEFQDSMMQAVSSAGQLEQAQLDQYARMLHAKFSDFDSDQSNGISMAEWQALSQAGQQAAEDAQKKQAAQKNAQLKALFDKADSEQADGKLTQVEMLSGFAQYGYDSAQVTFPNGRWLGTDNVYRRYCVSLLRCGSTVTLVITCVCCAAIGIHAIF